jgi:hypothetical protein
MGAWRRRCGLGKVARVERPEIRWEQGKVAAGERGQRGRAEVGHGQRGDRIWVGKVDAGCPALVNAGANNSRGRCGGVGQGCSVVEGWGVAVPIESEREMRIENEGRKGG